MEKERRTELLLMEQIELDGSQSQRRIAAKLGIAVGLTNAYVKRLVNKGYVMVGTMPRNRIWYNLTPKGISEKARLTLLFMKDSVNLYAGLRHKIQQAAVEMERADVSQVALVGDGELLEIALLGVLDTNLKLAGLFTTGTQTGRIARRPVKPLGMLADAEYDAVLFADLNPDSGSVDRLLAAGARRGSIMLLNGAWLGPREGGAP